MRRRPFVRFCWIEVASDAHYGASARVFLKCYLTEAIRKSLLFLLSFFYRPLLKSNSYIKKKTTFKLLEINAREAITENDKSTRLFSCLKKNCLKYRISRTLKFYSVSFWKMTIFAVLAEFLSTIFAVFFSI